MARSELESCPDLRAKREQRILNTDFDLRYAKKLRNSGHGSIGDICTRDKALKALFADEAGMRSLPEPFPERGFAAERLLLREFSHRINNELASAISLISVAANRVNSDEARIALAAVQDRLESYARVHHSLQMPEYTTAIDLTAYIHNLCRAISHSKLQSKDIELSLSLYPLTMNSDRCWFLGMIVFELITNAARHAFNGKAGSIHLQIKPAGTSVECCVTDNGTSEPSLSPGRGLAIVESLAAGLHGTVDMQFGPNGTRTIVNFPRIP